MIANLNRKVAQHFNSLPDLLQNLIIGHIGFLFIFPPYASINYLMFDQQASTLTTSLDSAIPFLPWTVFIYAWVVVFLFLPIFVLRYRPLIIKTVYAYTFNMFFSCVIFLLYPVRYIRPEVLPPHNFIDFGVAITYFIDNPINCFPSLHVSNAFLAAFASFKVNRKIGYPALFWAICISLSTLTMKQHYIADVIFGLLVASVSYFIFLHKPNASKLIAKFGKDKIRFSTQTASWVIILYGIIVLIFVFLYLGGLKIPVDKIKL